MRLIDADKMAVDESEAYMSAQVQITDDLKWLVNFAAHSKIQRLIADTPTVDAVPVVHGRWRESGPLLECQSCGEVYSRLGGNAGKLWNYCPNCGAKMDGGGDDEM